MLPIKEASLTSNRLQTIFLQKPKPNKQEETMVSYSFYFPSD